MFAPGAASAGQLTWWTRWPSRRSNRPLWTCGTCNTCGSHGSGRSKQQKVSDVVRQNLCSICMLCVSTGPPSMWCHVAEVSSHPACQAVNQSLSKLQFTNLPDSPLPPVRNGYKAEIGLSTHLLDPGHPEALLAQLGQGSLHVHPGTRNNGRMCTVTLKGFKCTGTGTGIGISASSLHATADGRVYCACTSSIMHHACIPFAPAAPWGPIGPAGP